MQAQLLAAKIAEEKASESYQDAYSELNEQKDVTAEAESLYSEQLAGEQAQADLDKAQADAVTAYVTTDIAQGEGRRVLESIEQS